MLKFGNNNVRFLRRKLQTYPVPTPTPDYEDIHYVYVGGTKVFDDNVHFDWKITYTAILISSSPITYQYNASVMVNAPVRDDGYPCASAEIQIGVDSFDAGEPSRVLFEETPFNAVVATGYATYQESQTGIGQWVYSRDGRVTTSISYSHNEFGERIYDTIGDFLFNAYPVPYILEPSAVVNFTDNRQFY